MQISYADSLPQSFEYVYCIKLTRDELFFYGCGGKGLLFRYSYVENTVELFKGHRFEVWSFVLFEDKKMMASTGYDQRVLLWDTNTRELLGVFTTANRFNQTLTFHSRF